MGFSRQEYWSGLPWPPPGDLPDPGIEPRSPELQADSLLTEPSGKPKNTGVGSISLLQGIFPTHVLNQGLQHCRRILYQLSYQGSPIYRHTLFKFALLYCISQILHFSQIRVSLLGPFFQHLLFTLCLCHIFVIHAVFQTLFLLIHLLYWSVITELWCYYCNCFGAPWPHTKQRT